MDKKELDKLIEKAVLKMALDPNNIEHYHELAKYYAMDNQYENANSSSLVMLSVRVILSSFVQ